MPIITSQVYLENCHVGRFQGHNPVVNTAVVNAGLEFGEVHAHVNGLNGAMTECASLTMSFEFNNNSGLQVGAVRTRHYTFTAAGPAPGGLGHGKKEAMPPIWE